MRKLLLGLLLIGGCYSEASSEPTPLPTFVHNIQLARGETIINVTYNNGWYVTAQGDGYIKVYDYYAQNYVDAGLYPYEIIIFKGVIQ